MITAVGTSLRMGGGLKKEYRLLRGTPVLVHAILPFLEGSSFYPVVVTVPVGDRTRSEALLSPHLDVSRLTLVEGGETRQQSVYRALKALQSDAPAYVLIHDGARPWLSRDLIDRVLESTRCHDASVPVVRVLDAMKELGQNDIIERHVFRERIVCAQTPQGFSFARLLSAHREASMRDYHCVDDAEVFAAFEGPVASVLGDVGNRKITYSHDLGSI